MSLVTAGRYPAGSIPCFKAITIILKKLCILPPAVRKQEGTQVHNCKLKGDVLN